MASAPAYNLEAMVSERPHKQEREREREKAPAADACGASWQELTEAANSSMYTRSDDAAILRVKSPILCSLESRMTKVCPRLEARLCRVERGIGNLL